LTSLDLLNSSPLYIIGVLVYLLIYPLGLLPWEILIDEILLSHNIQQTFSLRLCLSIVHVVLCIPAILFCLRGLQLMTVFIAIPVQIFLKDISLIGEFYDRHLFYRKCVSHSFHCNDKDENIEHWWTIVCRRNNCILNSFWGPR